MAPDTPDVSGHEHIGTITVAAMLGLTAPTLSNYRARDSWPEGFPAPVAHRPGGPRGTVPLWNRADVARYLAEHGAELGRRRRRPVDPAPETPDAYARAHETRAERDADIRARRAAGETLAAIGARYGITRERVRQICALPPAVAATKPGRCNPEPRILQRDQTKV